MILAPGIRSPVFFGGYAFNLGPTGVEDKVETLSATAWTIDTTPVTDRPIAWGTDQVASPEVIEKHTVALHWDQISEADYDKLQEILATPGPFPLCIWRPDLDSFVCDGVKTLGMLSAGIAVQKIGSVFVYPPALTFAPQNPTQYAAERYKNGSPFAGFDVDSLPDSNGRQFVDLTSYAAGDVYELLYVPLYMVRRTDTECSFSPGFREDFSITLETY